MVRFAEVGRRRVPGDGSLSVSRVFLDLLVQPGVRQNILY